MSRSLPEFFALPLIQLLLEHTLSLLSLILTISIVISVSFAIFFKTKCFVFQQGTRLYSRPDKALAESKNTL